MVDVTLLPLEIMASNKLAYRCTTPYEESPHSDPTLWEALHIAHLFEQAEQFDIIHNHYDFLPLTYSRLVSTPMVTTIHGFSSRRILPVYQEYNAHNHYVSISYADRHPSLDYVANVYHGIDMQEFDFALKPTCLLFRSIIPKAPEA